jgi:16S rRNA (adenine1518-N6/adenine1519-N6)-dimethyltransferase
MNAAERQTRSYLTRLLQQHGLNPRHDLGQNFLIDLNIIDLIVREAAPDARDVVLEVGAGAGSLTAALAPHVAAVVAVELDPKLHTLARDAVAAFPHATVIQADALYGKHRLNPAVLAAVEAALSADAGRRLKLVANLPYSVATPVISNLVATDLPWERIVVTIQYELAQRIVAVPRTADYSTLSVWLQSQCRIALVRKLPPAVFWPRPKVDSAVVRIEPDADRRLRIADREFFHDYVRRVFQHRRKHLRSVLRAMYRQLNSVAVDGLLVQARLSATARAEELDALNRAIHKQAERGEAGAVPLALDSQLSALN